MRPKNLRIGQDVGWEMREKFQAAGYQGKILEARNTRVYKDGPFRNIICSEYYLAGYNDPFACHFGRGVGAGIAKYKEQNALLRLPFVNSLARRIKGHKEKRKWLDICLDIISQQTQK